MLALPGGDGTASQVSLALGVGRPVVAYLDRCDEIPRLPEVVEHRRDRASIKVWLEVQLERWAAGPGGSSGGGRTAP